MTLGAGSVTAVLLEPSAVTGLEGQRTAALKTLDGLANNNTAGVFDNLSTVADRPDLPRIEVVSGNLASFLDGSTTLATGGQIAVSARRQTLLDAGARLDVAGAIGVRLAMESNNLKIDVQGNEQRDAPVNRDSKLLNNSEIWIDRRTLVKVPGGANGYAGERWYTGGGLLEVGGYLATSGRTASEWLAQGRHRHLHRRRAGHPRRLGHQPVRRHAGRAGRVHPPELAARCRRPPLRRVARARRPALPACTRASSRCTSAGATRPRGSSTTLDRPRTRFENGYTVGRDAGALIVSTRQARLEGGVTGEVYQGPRQTDAPQWDMDGYLQSQTTVARRGRLIVGSYLPRYDADSGQVNWALAALAGKGIHRRRSGRRRRDTPGRRLAERGQSGSADRGRQGKDRRRTGAGVRPGAGVLLYAPQVDIQAGIAAQGGRIQAGNVLRQVNDRGVIEDVLVGPRPASPPASRWRRAPRSMSAAVDQCRARSRRLARPGARNGGQVALRSSGSIALGQGSLVDVSGGAAIQSGGKALAGRGGDLLLEAGSAGRPACWRWTRAARAAWTAAAS